MNCPLCSTQLRQHLLQPTLSIIACPQENCIFPFNLTVAQLHEQNLLITDITNEDIMNGMYSKMVDDANVDGKIAYFISRNDEEINK